MTRQLNKSVSITAGIFICMSAGLVGAYNLWGQEYIATDRCLDAGGAYNKEGLTCDKTAAENAQSTLFAGTGPVDVGELNGQTVRLQLQDDIQRYWMSQGGLRMVCDLNTEKGFAQDDNAVVYVLNPYGDASRQIRLLV